MGFFSWFLNKLDFGVFKARTLLWAYPGLCLTHMASKRSPKLVLKASKKVVKKWITKMVQNVIKKGAKKVHKRWSQIVKNRSDRTLVFGYWALQEMWTFEMSRRWLKKAFTV